MHTSLIVGCCALLLFGNCCWGQDSKLPEEEVLQNMQAFDALFESGATVSGSFHTRQMANSRPRRTVEVKLDFKLTFDADRLGYEITASDHETPPYSAEHANAEGIDIFQVKTKLWGYWGADVSGTHNVVTYYHISANGDVKDNGTTSDSLVFGPNDAGPNKLKWIFLWSLGRKLASQIDKVETVEKLSDGEIKVTALGHKGPGRSGKLQLQIDSAAGWMVRRAEMYDDQIPDSKILDMKCEGTKWIGAFCIPTEAEINFIGPIGDEQTHYLKFTKVDEGFDEKLYQRCSDVVVRNQEPALTVHDLRVVPPTMSQPNMPPSVAAQEVPKSKKAKDLAEKPIFSNVRLVFFFLNLFLLLAVLGVYAVRRRKQN